MTIRNVALIYDDRLRPETTGTYCRRALESLELDVQHVRPDELQRLPQQGVDLYLNIDDGLEYELPRDARPCVYWAIDTHMDFAGRLARAQKFDLVFSAQRDGARRLEQEGVSGAQWLPLGCDPQIHRPYPEAKQYDVCFIGNLFEGPRRDLVRLLQQHFPAALVDRRFFAEMARAYSASRVVFNRSIKNDVNMRVFEGLACGSLLLTNDLEDNGQSDLFQDGVHLATYRDAEELLDKVRWYLDHPQQRQEVQSRGREEAHARHTYRLRMEQLLSQVQQRLQSYAAVPRALGRQEIPDSSELQDGTRPGFTKDRGYFEFDRPELLERIPTTARRVLEIGCGGGRLGAAVKSRQGAEVVGIECDQRAAQAAQQRLDRVLVGDVEKMKLDRDLDLGPERFDCLVCGDVLEHLEDPQSLLERARDWLTPQACLIASIPNVRNHTVVASLLEGNWTYEPAGLLDDTHLRFFTRGDIETLLERAGYRIERLEFVPGPGYREWLERGRPGKVVLGRHVLSSLSAAEAEEFFVYQYLVTATIAGANLSLHESTGAESRIASAAPRLGCVLAIQDRSEAALERTLQTYAFQTLAPVDQVLLDYGSRPANSRAYRQLAEKFAWRYERLDPPDRQWSLPAAYNAAVLALSDEVDVVFKNDGEILLGPHVLEAAARFGCDRLAVFACLSTVQGVTYPPTISPTSLLALLTQEPRPREMPGWGVHAFPKHWFSEVGGYDLHYGGWGYEDADLRLRAGWSIGVVDVTSCSLLHQWHPRGEGNEYAEQASRNRDYYQSTKPLREVLRNGGRLRWRMPPADESSNGSVESQPPQATAVPARVDSSELRSPSAIPNTIYFCFGLAEDFGGKPFSLVHYLAVRSAIEVNRPEHACLLYRYEPEGPWWERARELLELRRIQPPREIYGNPLLHVAHQADVVRLRTLLEEGGIYLDLDVICLRPFTELRTHDFVIGQETDGGLCNAILLARPGAPFLERWLETYRWFRSRGRDAYWGEHSVRVPAQLAGEHPDEVHVLGPRKFFWPMHWEHHLRQFFTEDESDGSQFTEESYCVHLWEQLAWENYLRDLTPQQIREGRSEFCRLARRFLAGAVGPVSAESL